jgi:hypothetical protein
MLNNQQKRHRPGSRFIPEKPLAIRPVADRVSSCSVNTPPQPIQSIPSVRPPAVQSAAPARAAKGQLRSDFINALKVDGFSERTIESYCAAVTMFQSFLHHDPLDVKANDIRAFFFI